MSRDENEIMMLLERGLEALRRDDRPGFPPEQIPKASGWKPPSVIHLPYEGEPHG